MLNQLLHILPIGRVESDTDGRASTNFVVGETNWLCKGADNLARQDGRALGFVEFSLNYRKLVPTETRHRIGLANHHPQNFRNRLEQFVANRMAQGIVDLFEAVEIEEVDS